MGVGTHRGLLRRGPGGGRDTLGFDYDVRQSSRAKRVRISVGERGVEVVVPQGASERLAHEFVRERAPWVRRALERIDRAEATVAARPLIDGSAVPYLGRELRLRLRVVGAETGEADARSRPRPRSGSVELGSGESACELYVCVTDDSREGIANALVPWYRRRARVEIGKRLDRVVARNHTTYARLAIRDQRTRWGSCSSSGTLSFNWRLLLAPEAVLDYVIEHEAAHIEVPGHSPRFWALLDARDSEWRCSREWLREHGATLRLV